MEKTLFQELGTDERRAALSQAATKREPLNYTHQFTEEELAERRKELAEVVTELVDLEEDRKATMERFNNTKKGKEEVRNALVERLRAKSEARFGDCWKFVDYEDRKVGYYDDNGILVLERDMLPQEAQREMHFAEANALPEQTPEDVDFEEVEE